MDILKKLLSSTFDKKIDRLESRTKTQLTDLKYTEEWFNKQNIFLFQLNEKINQTIKDSNNPTQRSISPIPLKKIKYLTRMTTPDRIKRDIKTTNNIDISQNKPKTLSIASDKSKQNNHNTNLRNKERPKTPDILLPKHKSKQHKPFNQQKKTSSPQKNVRISIINRKFLSNNPNDNYKSINLYSFLTAKSNKSIYFLILNYLPFHEQITFCSLTKKFKTHLLTKLHELKTKFEMINNISPYETLQDKLTTLISNNKNDNNAIDIEHEDFKPSQGAEKAFEIVNDNLYNKVFHNEKLTQPITTKIVPYRILFQLMNMNEITSITDDDVFWKEVCTYITSNATEGFGTFLKSIVNSFDFSEDNIYKIKHILNKYNCQLDEMKPTYYSRLCGTTGMMMFLLQDAFEYCGFSKEGGNKTIISRIRNIKYLISVEKKFQSYIQYIKDNM
jgi:hypothetical protein